MVKVIQDLWILTQSGKLLYQRVFDEKMHTQLFGALISALNSFAQELTSKGLVDFEFGLYKFIVLRKKQFLFIGTSNIKVKKEKIQNELKKIIARFFEKYTEILADWENWDRNIDTFSDFKKTIRNLLKIP
jgi:hypothetical protein